MAIFASLPARLNARAFALAGLVLVGGSAWAADTVQVTATRPQAFESDQANGYGEVTISRNGAIGALTVQMSIAGTATIPSPLSTPPYVPTPAFPADYAIKVPGGTILPIVNGYAQYTLPAGVAMAALRIVPAVDADQFPPELDETVIVTLQDDSAHYIRGANTIATVHIVDANVAAKSAVPDSEVFEILPPSGQVGQVNGGVLRMWFPNSDSRAQSVSTIPPYLLPTIDVPANPPGIGGTLVTTLPGAGETGAPALILDRREVRVPESTLTQVGIAEFQVKLPYQPTGTVTVTADLDSTVPSISDPDIRFRDAAGATSGTATLTFDATNWNVFQKLTLTAANDIDTVNGFLAAVDGHAFVSLTSTSTSPTTDVYLPTVLSQVSEIDKDLPSIPALLANTRTVDVPEGQTRAIGIKLASAPPTDGYTWDVTVMPGSDPRVTNAGISVIGTKTFDTTTTSPNGNYGTFYDWYQYVEITATQTAGLANGIAILKFTSTTAGKEMNDLYVTVVITDTTAGAPAPVTSYAPYRDRYVETLLSGTAGLTTDYNMTWKIGGGVMGEGLGDAVVQPFAYRIHKEIGYDAPPFEDNSPGYTETGAAIRSITNTGGFSQVMIFGASPTGGSGNIGVDHGDTRTVTTTVPVSSNTTFTGVRSNLADYWFIQITTTSDKGVSTTWLGRVVSGITTADGYFVTVFTGADAVKTAFTAATGNTGADWPVTDDIQNRTLFTLYHYVETLRTTTPAPTVVGTAPANVTTTTHVYNDDVATTATVTARIAEPVAYPVGTTTLSIGLDPNALVINQPLYVGDVIRFEGDETYYRIIGPTPTRLDRDSTPAAQGKDNDPVNAGAFTPSRGAPYNGTFITINPPLAKALRRATGALSPDTPIASTFTSTFTQARQVLMIPALPLAPVGTQPYGTLFGYAPGAVRGFEYFGGASMDDLHYGDWIDFSIDPIDDTATEGAETVTLTLQTSNNNNGYDVLDPQQSTAIISDNDSVASIVANGNASEPSYASGFTVSFTNAFPKDITVPFALSFNGAGPWAAPNDDATATQPWMIDADNQPRAGGAGRDFSIPNFDATTLIGSIVLPAGQTSVVIPVTPLSDARVEGNEQVQVRLVDTPDYVLAGNQNGGVNATAATLDITDSLGVLSLTVSPVSVTDPAPVVAPNKLWDTAFESDTNPDTLSAHLLLGIVPAQSVISSIPFTITGSATGGTDYTLVAVAPASVAVDYAAGTGTITIPASTTSVMVKVVAGDDTIVEPTETVIVTLTGGPGYTLGAQSTQTVSLLDDEPVVSITPDGDASEPSTAGKFKVSYPGAPAGVKLNRAITVNYVVDAASTATAGTDYQTLSGSVVIPSGQNEASIVVTPYEDLIPDAGESVIVNLVPNPTVYTINSGSAKILIKETPSPVGTLSIAPLNSLSQAVLESDRNNPAILRLTLARDATADNRAIRGSYQVTGTATPVTDYDLLDSIVYMPQLTIASAAANGADVDLVVTVTDSNVNDPPTCILYNGTVVRLGKNPGILATVTGAPTDGLPLSTTPGQSQTITLSGITLVQATDPTNSPAGVCTQDLRILPIDDNLVEPDETVIVALKDGLSYTRDTNATTATVTIQDDEPIVQLVTPTVDALEGTDTNVVFGGINHLANHRDGVITVSYVGFTRIGAPAGTLPSPITKDLTVYYTVTPYNAAPGVDYKPLTGSVTINALTFSADIDITPIDNQFTDPTRGVTITLQPDPGGVNYSVDPLNDSNFVYILDDEPEVLVEKSQDAYEGGAPGKVTVSYTSSNPDYYRTSALPIGLTITGTATNGVDCNSIPTTASIAPGPQGFNHTVDVVITPLNDTIAEGDETILITPTASSLYYTSGYVATTYIFDDERTIGFNSTSLEAVEGTTAVFTITRVNQSVGAVSLTYHLGATGDTAVVGRDYAALTDGTLSWADGDISPRSVSVTILGQSTADPERFATLVLSNLTGNASFGQGKNVWEAGADKTYSVKLRIIDPVITQPDARVQSGDSGGGCGLGSGMAAMLSLFAFAVALHRRRR